MTYTIKYRDKSGSVKTMELDAPDRSAVFAEARKRVISVISVAEGGSGHAHRGVGFPHGKLPIGFHGIVAGAVVVLGAVLVWWFLVGRGTLKGLNPEVEKKGHVKTSLEWKDVPVASETTIVRALETAPSPEKPNLNARIDFVAVTNSDGSVIERWKTPDGKSHTKIIRPKPAFTNPMDQLMAMVVPREPGEAVPPVPISNDMVLTPEQESHMLEKLTIDENDPDSVAERKELVQAMRREYLELKKKYGWTFVDYIKAHEAQAKTDNEVLVESYKLHDTIFGNPEISDADYLETLGKINKVLSERGISPIKPPEGLEDAVRDASSALSVPQEIKTSTNTMGIEESTDPVSATDEPSGKAVESTET